MKIDIEQEEICGTWHCTAEIGSTKHSFWGWDLDSIMWQIRQKMPINYSRRILYHEDKFPKSVSDHCDA